ncbi:hypothetical protein [Nostoc sp.]
MLNIASSFLSTEPFGDYRAHLAEIYLQDNNFAPLVTVDFGGSETLVVEVAEVITLPVDWENVTAIASNGQTFTPATNPDSPQSGEFLYNPYTNTVQVYGATGQSIQISGTLQEIKFSPHYSPSLPTAIYQSPDYRSDSIYSPI